MRITCSLASATLLKLQNRVEGTRGRLRVFNPLAPHFYHRLTVEAGGECRRERVPGDATYTHQLRHFVARVRGAPPGPTEARDGVANMRIIDAIYRAAGLPPRGT